VHYHLYPPQIFAEANSFAEQIRSLPGVKDWEPSRAADELDRDGIGTAVISFANPTLWSMDREPQRRLARLCNDYFAQVVRDHPRRFGLFACLPPLDDVDGALAEIDYACDTLKVEGVRVMTSYRDRLWLGDPHFAPVWDELDRRAAVVFVHPDLACFNPAAPLPSLELPFDTARTGASLWRAGAFARWPRIRFIFCHAGGPVPMLTSRLNLLGRPGTGGSPLRDAETSFRNAYFDTAQAAGPTAMAALLAFADPARILFGSDKPFALSAPQAAALAEIIEDKALLRAIERDNALALMPSLAA
jgi:predicted TIM-barrel fold metal-dependent hydrolase